MENMLLSTPTDMFLDTPAKMMKNSISNDELAEAVSDITNVLEHLSLELRWFKSETNAQIQKLTNIIATDQQQLKITNREQMALKDSDTKEEMIRLKNEIAKLKIENTRLRKETEEKEMIVQSILQATANNKESNWTEVTSKSKTRYRYTSNVNTFNCFQPLQVDNQSRNNSEEMNVEEENNMLTETIIRPNKVKQIKKPHVIVNYHQENDKGDHTPKTVPGNSTYKDVVKFGKKTFILGTSMVKGIRMKEFNHHLKQSIAKLRPFPGATLKQLTHYAKPTLVDETLNRIVIHGGCNDIGNRSSSEQSIAENVIKLADMCRQYGVNEVFVSSITCRKNDILNKKIKKVNFLLNLLCKENGFTYIDNSNIGESDLWEDGLHLLESGKVKLANNYIYSLNSF